MQTKNNSSEFSNKQFNQIKQLREMVRLHKLQEKCQDFKNELESLTAERCECLEKQEKFMEHLTSIQKELNVARSDESSWQIKLEDVKSSAIDDQLENLQNTCLLLGYQFSKCQLLENYGLQITLNYRNVCYVSFREISELYDIVEIYPPHPNLSQIQQYLQNSQDLRGFLTCLRKFFDIAIQFKESCRKE